MQDWVLGFGRMGRYTNEWVNGFLGPCPVGVVASFCVACLLGWGGGVSRSLGRAARPVVFGPASVGPLAGFGGCGLGWVTGRWGSGVWRGVALGVGDPLGRDPLFGAGGARAGGITQIRKTSPGTTFSCFYAKHTNHIKVNLANTNTQLNTTTF